MTAPTRAPSSSTMPSSSTTAAGTSVPRPRPAVRGPGRTLTVVGLAIVGAGIGFNYVAKTMRENELAQKKSGTGNFYVSVDRSGGGI